jgi:hypothetical protein
VGCETIYAFIGRQREAILGRPDPVRKMLPSEICRRGTSAATAPGAIASATIRPFSSIAPPPTAHHAHYFRAAPNDPRVVINVDHNVHTIPIECSHSLSDVG